MSKLLLDVTDLEVHFPVFGGVFQRKVAEVKAVDGITFSMNRSETLGLVGESGCGKTTVGRAIVNVLRHVSSDVHIDGSIEYVDENGKETDLISLSQSDMRPHRQKIQMIFQDPYSSLNQRLTVKQIVSEPLEIHQLGMSKSEVSDKVFWLLEKVGLQPEYASRYPHEFSGGQRQRIGIARALATNPDLIVCDEPVSALDVSVQAQVINLMMDLKAEFGMSYLFIAHDLSVVYHISDKIAVMYLGNIVEIGTADQVYFAPTHPYTKALISAVPEPDPDKTRVHRTVLKGDIPTPLNKPSGCAFRTRCPIARKECADQVPFLETKKNGSLAACPYVD
ncbi:MAG: ATP-binding cassette domain-containing protein [Ignavibacteria bacterium]|nr:ATP-binding cassette domain-containing protein [Ignavibacteria bacterium]